MLFCVIKVVFCADTKPDKNLLQFAAVVGFLSVGCVLFSCFEDVGIEENVVVDYAVVHDVFSHAYF